MERVCVTARAGRGAFRLTFGHRAPLLMRTGDLRQGANLGSVRQLNIFTVFSKQARENERARLADELNRGYFDDFKDLKRTGGKVGLASNNLVPVIAAVQFPQLTAFDTHRETFVLPAESSPKHATLVCLAFRASAEGMVDSWTKLFMTSFQSSQSVELVQVSVVEPWFLSLRPVRSILLRAMRSPVLSTEFQPPRRTLYAFGDTYYFRKELGIPNVLAGHLDMWLPFRLSPGPPRLKELWLRLKPKSTSQRAYVFLLDRKGRVRWRASGFATTEELSSMVSCITRLLQEQ